jgi:NADH-quinone oxidoreductase subunit L
MNFSDPNNLLWLIPAGPLLAFFVISLITNRARLLPATDHHYGGHHPDYDGMDVPIVRDSSRVLSIIVAMSGVTAAWLMSWRVFFHVQGIENFGVEIIGSRLPWMDLGMGTFQIGVMVDPLTAVMLFMVPLAMTMIFIYAIGYMAHDPRQSRFFALLSLFAGAMLTLVVSDNVLMMFIGWEVMGLCSYMLIGFWFEKESAYKAAIKAFTTTRVADVLMLLGIVYLYAIAGTLSFRDILYNDDVLHLLEETPAILFGGALSAAELIGIFLIIGTIGKAAQFPLHVWLPDAMEGPTPVSAMIHAAAMVSAGVYAVIRMFPVLEAGMNPHDGMFSASMLLLVFAGGFTALFAATIAITQFDVKAVLAYSTISQLGFMVAALGIGAYVAAAFHLITHAFFKALLFMSAGAVIHAVEHGEHHVHEHAHGHDDHHAPADVSDEAGHKPAAPHEAEDDPGQFPDIAQPYIFDPQDMRNMGGLRHKLPVTFVAFTIGGLSLAGFPLLTAGFWSKDEILADAWLGITHGYGPQFFVFFMLAMAAFLTAFYTTRQIALTFFGEARSEAAEHATLGEPVINITMVAPLVILAAFALFAGFVGVPPDFPIFGFIFSNGGENPFFAFVNASLLHPIPKPKFVEVWPAVLTSFGVALGGIYLGYVMYIRKPLAKGQEDPLIQTLGPLWTLLENKYYIDELYEIVFIRPSQLIGRLTADVIDRGVIDGFLHLIARVSTFIGDLAKVFNYWLIDGFGDAIPDGVGAFGNWFRRIQTGRVQQYLLLVAIAIIMIGLLFALSTGVLAQATGF